MIAKMSSDSRSQTSKQVGNRGRKDKEVMQVLEVRIGSQSGREF